MSIESAQLKEDFQKWIDFCLYTMNQDEMAAAFSAWVDSVESRLVLLSDEIERIRSPKARNLPMEEE
jgi:hypothetical protein